MKRERLAYVYLPHSVQEFMHNIETFFLENEPYTQEFLRENQTVQGRCKKFVKSKTTRKPGP
jgi:hypothetical protein